MKVVIEDQEIEVVIEKKRANRHTYLRVKDDLKLHVTTNIYSKDKDIVKLVYENQKAIKRMLEQQERRQKSQEEFTYLGQKYDLVYLNTKEVIVGETTIFLSHDMDIEEWFLKQAKEIFPEELEKIYNIFPVPIPYPSLTIRKMKTRWGVCNVKTKRVTLNLELIKKDKKYLDYVIAHELSHLIHPNHSKEFWALVERVIPNYKILRKEMRNYE